MRGFYGTHPEDPWATLYPGGRKGSAAADIGAGVGRTALSFTSSIVGTLATSAAASSSVPVAGWIAAAAQGAVAGLLALVNAVVQAKIRRQDAVVWAAELGLPDAETVPGYIVRVQGMSLRDRIAEAGRLTRAIDRTKGKRRRTLEVQRGIIGALLSVERAMLTGGNQAHAAPQPVLVQTYGTAPAPATVIPGVSDTHAAGLAALAAGMLGAVVVVARRR